MIKNEDARNILGINSAISLNLVKLKSDDKNKIDKTEEEHNNIVNYTTSPLILEGFLFTSIS